MYYEMTDQEIAFIPTVIVIPCRNEQELLLDTCKSLGFGLGAHQEPAQIHLILTDNDSTDETPLVMEQVLRSSRPGCVSVVQEPVRGYVPARHRGMIAAREWALNQGYEIDTVLAIQADADTEYGPAYVSAMRDAAQACSPPAVWEGRSILGAFEQQNPRYVDLMREADRPVAALTVDEAFDVIIDDKVAAFRLGDYFGWGGHTREFNTAGDEVLAETSRLFLKARMRGARKLAVPNAVAFSSKRKAVENPGLYFATAGFPRGRAWTDRWRARYDGPYEIARLDTHEHFNRLAAMRQAHMLVLFCILPLYVDSVMGGGEYRLPRYRSILPFLDAFRPLSPDSIRENTGPLLEDALSLVDTLSIGPLFADDRLIARPVNTRIAPPNSES